MQSPQLRAPRLPTLQHLVAALVVIIPTVEALVHVFLPMLIPDSEKALQGAADAFFLTVISAPFIWVFIARPLRVMAISELARKQATLDHIVDAVINFDAAGRVESFNPAAAALFGYAADEVIGESIEPMICGIERCLARCAGLKQAAQDNAFHCKLQAQACRKDGRSFPVEVSVSRVQLEEGCTFIAIVHDITERKRYQEKLEYQANHDALTGLPNRNLLADRIGQALHAARRSGREVAVFFLDLDNFKYINDSLGHATGDVLLKIIAERLAGCVRAGDTVARQGGDEFVLVARDLGGAEDAGMIAAKIRGAVARPVQVSEHEFIVTVSIGISLFPKDGENMQTLMKHADTAMYRAKEKRDAFRFYADNMDARTLERLTMERHLRRALERDELLLHYQPKVSLRSGRVMGMEALLRWQSPELGLVSPAHFIPLAEETGLIEQIGSWVLRSACRQNKAWQEEGLPALPVAVNLSARQFTRDSIAAEIGAILAETALEPRFLELEITESLIMHNVERVSTLLGELKEIGVHLTMDDFGTGYSSLSYLKRFPFDKLKVDKSFVLDITSDPDSAVIAKAVIAMAKSLRLRVIAEGVETQGQLEYLRGLDCDEIQGFYFSRPLPSGSFSELLRSGLELELPALRHESAQGRPAVLVVDDESDVTAALQRMLRLEGYRVLAAASAEEGFELLATNRVTVVLSDQRMPGMSGSEFLGRVKDLYPDTVRMVLSAHCDLESITSAVNNGAIYKYLIKPWDDDHLRDMVVQAFAYAEQKKF